MKRKKDEINNSKVPEVGDSAKKEMNRINFFKILVAVILMLPVVWLAMRKVDLDRDHRYTIGVTTGSKGSDWIGYTYEVSGRTYSGQKRSLKYYAKESNGHYFIKFSPSNPSKSQIMWENPVPSHINQSPPDGWEEIPK